MHVTSEVLTAVHQYFLALHEGDIEGLAQAYHPRALYATTSGGETRILSVEEYLDVVRHRQSPRDLGDAPNYSVKAVQLAGDDTAVVTLHSEMMGKSFQDFLSLVRVEGRWRIIAKVFHFTPIPKEGA